MTTQIDICNRALSLIGNRNTISSLTQDSVEAQSLSLHYTEVLTQCLSMANWNFARKTAVLTLYKQVSEPPPALWTNVLPAPPWLFEYLLPTDFVKAIYLTNSTLSPTGRFYAGEAQRFQMAYDVTTGSTITEVLLCNQYPSAVLVYTSLVTDPTQWPGYFERFVVYSLAEAVAVVLASIPGLPEALDTRAVRLFMIAEQINREEGLIYADTTPEWIQAIGINYPMRRLAAMATKAGAPNDKQR